MFIAPQRVALCSSSIEGMTDKAVNILFQDAKAIESFTEEFNCYLSLCKPLMRIYTEAERQHFFQTLNEFEFETENSILKSNQLSLVTMPEHVVASMLDRLGLNTKNEIIDYYHKRRERFLENLKNRTFREIIKIADISNIKEGSVEIGYTGLKELSGIRYLMDEYRDHIKNLLDLLNKYDNYNLAIDRTTTQDNYRIYAKEDLSVIVEKITQPYVVFMINETNMTAAFWDYLNHEFADKKANKPNVIKELQGLIELL